MPRTPLALIAVALAAAGLSAQQFTERKDLLPGPVVWTEGVIPLDANEDGLLDILFTNCNGWRKPGDMAAPSADPLRPTLLVQVRDAKGALGFEDRTDALLPADFLVHAKNAAVFDADGDGHEDIAWAVAFGARQRLLRKDPESGRFVDASDRLPELVINANQVDYGDFDGDGDLDLVWVDSGPNSDMEPGGKARLCLNDGKGRFTEAADRLGAVEKVGAQNPKIVDIDGDLDLDIVVDGKSDVTQVYLNDGRGQFKLDLDLIPRPEVTVVETRRGERRISGKPYEIEWGDLDGDGDLDAVFMNYFGEGRQRYSNAVLANRLVENGRLSFEVIRDAFAGRNAEDENDFALLDADGDGDLDVICAVLVSGTCEEKLFLNSGRIGPGFLVEKTGAFTPFVDGTLDLALGDFDGDGRCDVITAQGESNRHESFRNRYYANTGPKDERAPVVVRQTPPAKLTAAAFARDGHLVRVQLRDGAVDDNVARCRAELLLRVGDAPAAEARVLPMTHAGGEIHQLRLRPPTAGFTGTLRYRLRVRDRAGNRSETEEVVVEIRAEEKK
ncbi:MAG: FG-GAP-like repeat-containing protein [Planctomycetota bacterium]